jgi:AcrR family transcriptional regulator
VPRPRSETVRTAILTAAIDLLEQEGYGRLSMEGIARRAGVSKQTVYRWWRTPAAVLLEALNEYAAEHIPPEDSGRLERDLRRFIRLTVEELRVRIGPLVARLMAEAQLDEAFAVEFRGDFLARRREALRDVLSRARERGEIRPDVDLDLPVEIAFGTIWYRVLSRHAPLSRRFADELTAALLVLCAGDGQASGSVS